MYLAVCAIFKDERESLREWLEWHLAVGVDHFYMYDNDSRDHPEELFSECRFRDRVTHVPWSGAVMQMRAYTNAITLHRKLPWLACIDIDEFLVPVSAPTVPEILLPFEGQRGVCVNWLVFGSSGRKSPPAEGVLRGYLKRGKDEHAENGFVKTIVCPRAAVRAFNAHKFTYKDSGCAVNLNGAEVPADGYWSRPPALSRLRLHHYCVKSREDFERKMKRGRADNANASKLRTWKYFRRMDLNEIADTSAAEMAERKGILK